MDKSLKLVTCDISAPIVSAIDWSNCFLCEEVTDEKLTCPRDHAIGGGGYKTLAKTLPAWYKLGQLPSSLKLDRLDDGDGLESTFIQQHAKYHKSCSLKYNEKNLQRATKRKSSDEMPQMPGKFTRQKITHSDHPDTACLFCNKPGTATNPLRNASTENLDTKVRQCTSNLQDQKLIAKLSGGGDVVAIEMKYHPQCLVALYNRDRAYQSSTSQESTTSDAARNTALICRITVIHARNPG